MTKYILAISGGIDSVTLLDKVAVDGDFRDSHFPSSVWPDDFVVAHFDHGIRPESYRDANFVKKLASRYGVKAIIQSSQLGANCNEQLARQARYDFLRSLLDDGDLIVTAHHRDDYVETAVMFISRGTGWRGLAVMSAPDIMRPLATYSKVDLARYAIEHNLTWVEDETNFSSRYFRNRLRSTMASWSERDRLKLFRLIQAQLSLASQIDVELNRVIKLIINQSNHITTERYFLIMIDEMVAIEILKKITKGQLTSPQLKQLLYFIKTAKPGKRMVWRGLMVKVSKRQVSFRLFIC